MVSPLRHCGSTASELVSDIVPFGSNCYSQQDSQNVVLITKNV